MGRAVSAVAVCVGLICGTVGISGMAGMYGMGMGGMSGMAGGAGWVCTQWTRA